jgi:hypothetical protein
MKVDKSTRDLFLNIQKTKKVSLEGNILKVIEADTNDTEFIDYLSQAIDKDKNARRRRLEITKQVQEQNLSLLKWKKDTEKLNEDLKISLVESERLKEVSEKAKDAALNDLDILQKKSETELIGTIVKVALLVILSVGIITTGLYAIAIWTNKDTQIIGSTWSNMFGVLLTNAFSIVGTIMGIKYATQEGGKEKK